MVKINSNIGLNEMAYTIDRYNGTTLTVVQDGTVDPTQILSLWVKTMLVTVNSNENF